MKAPGSTDPLALATEVILKPGGLDGRLERIFGEVLAHSVDYADLYFQLSSRESWSLDDGKVRDGSVRIEQGVGVRALAGEKTGLAYSDEIVLPALTHASRVARAIATQGTDRSVSVWRQQVGHQLYSPADPLSTLSDSDKVAWLERVDREARAADPRVVQVTASIEALHEIVLIANSEGSLSADVRPLVRFNVSVIAAQNRRREQGSCSGGGRYSLAELIANDRPLALAREAVRQALVNLEAVPAPAGTMTVVLGPGWPGVLLHEAIGHGLEGDFNRKGSSAFANRLGERVAAPGCTVVDDGVIASRRGSLNVDDEGTPTQCTTLIEDGVLRGYMHDRLNARLMGQRSTGNGRRQSFAHLTLPRMTNTYMRPGPYAPEEIIRSVGRGIYAVNFAGGSVDITSGKFVFSANEAYAIENGRLGAPLKGATLIGNGPDVLMRVVLVGNDLKLDEGIATCSKEGQSVPVGVGQPTLKIDGLTVGGTSSGRAGAIGR